MKKLILILAAAAFMVACTPKPQPVVEEPTDVDEIVMVDETEADVVADTPAPAPTKPATKPAAPKVDPPKEEPVVEQPKEQPKEEPKPDEPKTNTVKGRR